MMPELTLLGLIEDEDPFDGASDAGLRDYALPRSRKWIGDRKCEIVAKPKRKRVDFSDQQRRWFEKNGYTYARVEQANAFGAVTVDLWHFGDWLACRRDEILIVQTCRHDDASTRERKARKAPELEAWLAAGGRFEVHGWKQPGGPGTLWKVVVRPVEREERT